MAFLLSYFRPCAVRARAPAQFVRNATSVSDKSSAPQKSIREMMECAVLLPVKNYRRRRILTTVAKPVSATDICKEPLKEVTKSQMQLLDPTGVRRRLFSKVDKDAVRVGDILSVQFKSGEPFSGVLLAIKRKGIDSSIMLRDTITRVPVEMQVKIFSPNISRVDIVQRREKRARRAKLYYMRDAKHDIGPVGNIVREYNRRRAALGSAKTKGRNRR